MIEVGGLFFPDGEAHFTAYGDDVADYQRAQRDYALSFVKDWRLAVDVGGHCGIFSRHFAQRFDRVMTFEPMPELRECLALNVPSNVEIVAKAVSDHTGTCRIAALTSGNSGSSFIVDDDRVDAGISVGKLANTRILEVPLISIDSLDLPYLGLLKVDVQGADHLVLAGAAETFKRCGSVVIAEEKPIGGANGSIAHIAVMHEIMLGAGATLRDKVGADRIYTF